MSRICPLFSGSGGNSTYIGTSGGGLLIDAGASCKALLDAIVAAGGTPETLRAVAITHEHSDHVKGLKILLKKTGIPVIASAETMEALIRDDRIPADAKTIVAENGMIDTGAAVLQRFATSHDCPGSGGYVLSLPDGKRAAVCTDLGIVTDSVRLALSGCDFVLIESNHDITMLQNAPYPPMLKLRILSETGHLSNNACAAELPDLLKNGTTRFVLGHLSRNNNLPELARSAARTAIAATGARENDYILVVAKPERNEAIPL